MIQLKERVNIYGQTRHQDEAAPIRVLLVDDQVIIAEAVKRMLADQHDIELFFCNEPTNAIQMAAEVKPTVILQDLVMPDIDGLTLVRYFRANPATKEIPLIVLSVKEDPKIKADSFALGANDYAVKLPDKIELVARIRYHSIAYTRLIERNEAYEQLAESQRILNNELAEAADYVRTLLPKPLDNTIKTNWRFIPSTQLGGDAFGYHWIDEDNFAIYLLDVCGHGIGAALLSISVINVIRSQALPHTDFLQPVDVLTALNQTFPMEKHNNMFFTLWYGVFNRSSRELVYASGGHPPALLITGECIDKTKSVELHTPGFIIGGMEEAVFHQASVNIESYNRLYIFSDGVFEITRADSSILSYAEFVDVLKEASSGDDPLSTIYQFSLSVNGKKKFDDDFSLLEVVF